VVKYGEVDMKAKKRLVPSKPESAPSTRATISFPTELYGTLEGIAKQKKVSLAWVVREAVDKYVADQWPLFSNRKES
jgi:metal-responsive CopG/Arc/MetJ family transcriptional regulator